MMRSLLSLLLLLLLGGAAPAEDWSRTVSESAEGWTFGRPGAPLLAEYASFGCPNCGRFAASSGPAIEAAVKAGKMRLSFRPFLIFPHDRAAAVLARSVAPSRRLSFVKAVLAAQAETRARLAAADADEGQRARLLEADFGGPTRHSPLIAEASGLLDLASRHGLAEAAGRSCLASEDHHRWVTNADIEARVSGVKHTPTYVWQGRELGSDLTPERLVALLPR